MNLLLRISGAGIALALGAASTRPADVTSDNQAESETPFVAEFRFTVPRSKLFELWTTTDGVKKFWVEDAVIQPETGGRYDLLFDGPGKSDSRYLLMFNTAIREFVPDKVLSFDYRMYEWDAKTRELLEYPELRDTWVEIQFEHDDLYLGGSRLRLIHHGLDANISNELRRRYFELRWISVLKRLRRCVNGELDEKDEDEATLVRTHRERKA